MNSEDMAYIYTINKISHNSASATIIALPPCRPMTRELNSTVIKKKY